MQTGWKEISVIGKAGRRLGIAIALCAVVACQMEENAYSVGQSSDQPTVLSEFDVTKFEPGYSCRDDLPRGRYVTDINGYETRLIGQLNENPKSGLPSYLYSVSSGDHNCNFYYTTVDDFSEATALNRVYTQRNNSPELRKRLIELMGKDTAECHSVAFVSSYENPDAPKVSEPCVSIALQRLQKAGVVIQDSSDGSKRDFATAILVEGQVFWENGK